MARRTANGKARPATGRSPVLRNTAVGWCYPYPSSRYTDLQNYLAFYPALLECYVGGERVKPQPGRFYGGWITKDVVGPFKGEPGTGQW